MAEEIFSNKEMIKTIYNKVDKLDERVYNKIESMDEKLDSIHTQVKNTNGVVKIHTKLIWGAYGFTFACILGIITWSANNLATHL